MKVIYQVYHHKDRNLRRNQGKREESFIVALNAEYFCSIFSRIGRSLLSLDNTARKCPSGGQHSVCSSYFWKCYSLSLPKTANLFPAPSLLFLLSLQS